MNQFIIPIVTGLIMLAIGLAVGYYVSKSQNEKKRQQEAATAKSIIQDATERASKVELDARDRALKVVQSAETELNQRRNELNREDERLDRRRAELDGRVARHRAAHRGGRGGIVGPDGARVRHRVGITA